jgi:hypothetical protein
MLSDISSEIYAVMFVVFSINAKCIIQGVLVFVVDIYAEYDFYTCISSLAIAVKLKA